MNWKGYERKRSQPSSRPCISLEGLRKTTKTSSQDSRSPGRDLHLGHPEYEGVLTTRPRHSVRSGVRSTLTLGLSYVQRRSIILDGKTDTHTCAERDILTYLPPSRPPFFMTRTVRYAGSKNQRAFSCKRKRMLTVITATFHAWCSSEEGREGGKNLKLKEVCFFI
jgi:hypothetical protein